jgi:hypothetical protein
MSAPEFRRLTAGIGRLGGCRFRRVSFDVLVKALKYLP